MLNIIHNPDRADRFKTLMNELSEQGIAEYKLWPSIHDINWVHRGINLAHKQIIQYAKDEGLESVIVAEDDIQFFGKGAWDYWCNNEPEDYDIYLGGIYLGEVEFGLVKRFTGLTLYEVHNRFYDTFLNTSEYEHLDISLSGLGKFVVCKPFVVRQHNGYSDNEKRHMNYEIFFENREVFTDIK